jgi:hypothetical protein
MVEIGAGNKKGPTRVVVGTFILVAFLWALFVLVLRPELRLIQARNHLRALGFAIRMYQNDHGGTAPKNLEELGLRLDRLTRLEPGLHAEGDGAETCRVGDLYYFPSPTNFSLGGWTVETNDLAITVRLKAALRAGRLRLKRDETVLWDSGRNRAELSPPATPSNR